MSNIVNCTDKYAVSLRKTYDDIVILNDKVKTLNPENIRKNFDRFWNVVDSKYEESNRALENVDESMNNLEDSKELLGKINDVTDKVKQTLNSFRVGTLQGISQQTVKENDIMPNDEIAQNAVNQLETYNELQDLKQNNIIGGRKSRKRGKGRKGRKSRKSRNARF